jgi:hypothetical protein
MPANRRSTGCSPPSGAAGIWPSSPDIDQVPDEAAPVEGRGLGFGRSVVDPGLLSRGGQEAGGGDLENRSRLQQEADIGALRRGFEAMEPHRRDVQFPGQILQGQAARDSKATQAGADPCPDVGRILYRIPPGRGQGEPFGKRAIVIQNSAHGRPPGRRRRAHGSEGRGAFAVPSNSRPAIWDRDGSQARAIKAPYVSGCFSDRTGGPRAPPMRALCVCSPSRLDP